MEREADSTASISCGGEGNIHGTTLLLLLKKKRVLILANFSDFVIIEILSALIKHFVCVSSNYFVIEVGEFGANRQN